MLTYTMNSSMEQLQTEGFAYLEFRCKDCKKIRNLSLDKIESFLTLRQIEACSACGSCGQATQYLKPLQKKHLPEILIVSGSPVPHSMAPRPAMVQARPINSNIVSDVAATYATYVQKCALEAIFEKLVVSGRSWSEITLSEQKFLLDQESSRIKNAHLLKGGKLLVGLLMGHPMLF
ncbi:MAG: hypothetical protein ACRBEQ_13110 [Hyphomonas sp.]